MSFSTISVVGLGYIGLPTAAMFAAKQKKVIGVDVNQHIVDTIKSGKVHFSEPELDTMVKKALNEGLLKATTVPEPADAFLIAVPTPFLPIKHESSIPEPDLSYIRSASNAVSKVLKKGDLVILESTSPVGTTEQMSIWLSELRPDLTFPHSHGENSDIRVAYCPERVLPGDVFRELIDNDRIIGGITDNCSKTAIELYKIFVEGDCMVTNARTAEMAKLTENSCRDVEIAFANELSIICDDLGINVWELISLANRHPRVNILQPGPGVGGHCIAVDPWFIISKNPAETELIHKARQVNINKLHWVIDKVKILIEDFLEANPSKNSSQVTIVCYGLAFKEDISDLRESPAMNITRQIAEMHNGSVIAVEPNIKMLEKEKFNLMSLEEAEKKADIAVLLVSHKEFKMRRPKTSFLLDTKGIW